MPLSAVRTTLFTDHHSSLRPHADSHLRVVTIALVIAGALALFALIDRRHAPEPAAQRIEVASKKQAVPMPTSPSLARDGATLLADAAPNYTIPLDPAGNAPHAAECSAIDAALRTNDIAARRPQSGAAHDALRLERLKLQSRRVTLRC